MNAHACPDAAAQRAAFDALLARLRRDGDAGVGYEALRRRLLRYFQLHVPADASELADVTLDRLAHKLDEGNEIVSVPLYTLGIARMVLHEAENRAARWRAVDLDPDLMPDTHDTGAADPTTETEAAIAALEHCLDAAGPASRALVAAYYAADGGERIAVRQQIATEHGISVNALRNRMLRLRDALERCVRKRLGPATHP